MLQGMKFDQRTGCHIILTDYKVSLTASRPFSKQKACVIYNFSEDTLVRFGYPSQQQLKPLFKTVYRNVIKKKDSSMSLLRSEQKSSILEDDKPFTSNESKLLKDGIGGSESKFAVVMEHLQKDKRENEAMKVIDWNLLLLEGLQVRTLKAYVSMRSDQWVKLDKKLIQEEERRRKLEEGFLSK